jgi:uncharacterized membrane protein
MKDINQIVKSAMTSLLALTTATTLANTANSATTEKMEKCYGIVKAAMNDCQTATQSCAGSATKDKQPDAFIFLSKGVCNKIVGGSLAPQDLDKQK